EARPPRRSSRRRGFEDEHRLGGRKDQGAEIRVLPDVERGRQRQAQARKRKVIAMSEHPNNLTARAARWSAAHWKTATFGWLAFVVVAFALGTVVGTKQVDQNKPGPGESGRMQKILDDGFKQPVGENVLIQSRSRRVDDPSFTSTIRDVVAGVSRVAAV